MESTKIFDSEITSGPIRRLIEAKAEIDRVLSLLKEGKPKDSDPSDSEGEKPKHLCSWVDCDRPRATIKSGPEAGTVRRYCYVHRGIQERARKDKYLASISPPLPAVPGKNPNLCRWGDCDRPRCGDEKRGFASMCRMHATRYYNIKKGLPSPPMDAPIKRKESK